MELLKNLELVNVEYENEGQKAILTFLDEERGEVRTVNFNKQVYADGKYINDQAKEQKVESWCAEYFDTSFDKLQKAIGTRHDIYAYDNFNSLFEVEIVEKFTSDQVGEFFQTEISEIVVDSNAIRIRFPYDGGTYESKMTYAVYMEDMKRWFVDPLKKKKVFDKFAEKFHCTVENNQELIGKQINVEVKSAFGKFPYADIKKFPEKKGK